MNIAPDMTEETLPETDETNSDDAETPESEN
jgi:hypothetical protein